VAEPDTSRRLPTRGRTSDPAALLDQSTRGDRVALARVLSLIERGGRDGRLVASRAYRTGREARTVGITGPPGAGKSTLVNRLIETVRTAGVGPVGVLAVDPSSPFSGGAILGDRVRMQDHALDEGVYIRSMASRGHLGGLAVAVPESLRVLAAVGFPLVVVETVGVGQVEVEVAGATDTTVVVLNPRWGDSIQANKAGLLETADVFVINKSDMPGTRETRRDLEQMLELGGPADWRPPVVATVATTGEGVEELWEQITRHQTHLVESDELKLRRAERLEREFRTVLAAGIGRAVDHLGAGAQFAGLAREVTEHRVDPYDAAQRLLAEVLRAADARPVSSPDPLADRG
jgi:LAO/AO transport system kinase